MAAGFKLPPVSVRSIVGLGIVVALSWAIAWLLAGLLVDRRLSEQGQAIVSALENTAYALENEANRAAAAGATILMGLNDPVLKDAALGRTPPDAPHVLARLAISRVQFDATAAFIISADGTIVAHDTEEAKATGTNMA